MRLTELSKAVAAETGQPTHAVQHALRTAFDTIQQSLAGGDPVTIQSFGTFEVTVRKGRAGRNPATGEAMEVPARRVAKFKPSQAVKTAVNRRPIK